MAEDPPPPLPELTEEQKQRIETNRLRALAKRKTLLTQHHHRPSSNPQNPNDCWRLFKSRKVFNPSTNFPNCPKFESPAPSQRFRVRLEACSPDSFSITPYLLQGFPFPGQHQCFRILEDCLSNVSIWAFLEFYLVVGFSLNWGFLGFFFKVFMVLDLLGIVVFMLSLIYLVICFCLKYYPTVFDKKKKNLKQIHGKLVL